MRAKGLFLPKAVFLRTLSRSKSPELIEASWGNLASSRSVWVPFPTPGAPMRIMRAAFLSRLVCVMVAIGVVMLLLLRFPAHVSAVTKLDAVVRVEIVNFVIKRR